MQLKNTSKIPDIFPIEVHIKNTNTPLQKYVSAKKVNIYPIIIFK